MGWDVVGAVSDLVGAAAVVVSLIYLAFQIRQNTKQLEQNERTAIASSLNASATNYRENRNVLIANGEVTDIFLKGADNPESLDPSDLYRFRLLMLNFIDANWDIYAQTVATGFSPETWQAQPTPVIRRVLGTPGGRWFWNEFRADYSQEFQYEIDRILSAAPADEGGILKPQA